MQDIDVLLYCILCQFEITLYVVLGSAASGFDTAAKARLTADSREPVARRTGRRFLRSRSVSFENFVPRFA